MQAPRFSQYLTTKQLSERWNLSQRTLQRMRSRGELKFDGDRCPTHPKVGKLYSLAQIERIERSWRTA